MNETNTLGCKIIKLLCENWGVIGAVLELYNRKYIIYYYKIYLFKIKIYYIIIYLNTKNKKIKIFYRTSACSPSLVLLLEIMSNS
jgi:hypothetical protein